MSQKSAGAPLIAIIGDLIGILRMLAVLFPGTQIILLSGTQTLNTRHHCVEYGLGKIKKNKHYTVILEATLPKDGIEKRILEIWTEFGRFKATLIQTVRIYSEDIGMEFG